MGIYFIIFGLFLFFTFFDLGVINRKQAPAVRVIMLACCGLTMLFVAGLRWETGTDWGNYFRYFDYAVGVGEIGRTGFEIGWDVIAFSVRGVFGNHYSAMLFTVAAIIIIFTYPSVYKYSPYPLFSLFILFTYSVNSSGFGYRQDIAIALTFFSFRFIEERRLMLFLFFVIIASTVHQSAIVFIPAYWLYKVRWNVVSVVLFFFLAIAIFVISMKFKDIATLYSMSAAEKVSAYTEDGLDGGKYFAENPYVTLARSISSRMFFLVMTIFFVVKQKVYDVRYIGIFNIFIFGILLYVAFSPMSMVFGRLARYFDIFQIVLLPMAVYKANIKVRYLLIVLILSYSSFKFISIITKATTTYIPYKMVSF